MRASPEGRDELSERVQRVLSLPTKKEAEHVVSAVILSLETTLLTHLDTDGKAGPKTADQLIWKLSFACMGILLPGMIA